ncbi:hypothetical protein [Streptomyces sp. Wb2n-11]|uniref:hypothetical protein n=1 Tax=Streptomyces sp. Wb2n-11 TaxID=1030533 RepID=UPI000AED3426|nr:hypothetical protein [Streptomyces sp. Wb2n-11]
MAVAELHDGNAPEAPAPAEYRNGAGGTLGQTEAEPVEVEATQAQETAFTARTQATQDTAASRPASAEGLQDSRTASGAAPTGGGRRTGRTA